MATTCSTAKIERVQALGPDLTIDYQIQDFSRLIQDYDVVLDTVGGENEPLSLRVLKERAGAHYVSLLMPMAVYIDEYGFLRGGFSAIRELMSKKRACGKLGIKYDWGAFRFDAQALTAVKELIEKGKIKPGVDRTFPLSEIAGAHEYAESGKAFGKIGIEISSG